MKYSIYAKKASQGQVRNLRVPKTADIELRIEQINLLTAEFLIVKYTVFETQYT